PGRDGTYRKPALRGQTGFSPPVLACQRGSCADRTWRSPAESHPRRLNCGDHAWPAGATHADSAEARGQ
ncbi:MAG: hypothetical protein ACKOJF_26385, partial [Planctomycetaceae bacterium]